MTVIQENRWGQRWPAPAKLNLMLRITGRRPDGYHLLQTVFQLIDLCDWLTFHPVDGDVVELVNETPGVAARDDLTVRAALLLKQHTGCRLGVRIQLDKFLPMGGGLGGGSSDAATTLVVLNALWGLNLPSETLMSLGLCLGADVPVFVAGYSAWGEGVGEVLQPMILPESWFVVIKPDCHVNTKEIFLAEQLTRNSKSIRMSDFIAGDSRNDCLAVVRDMYEPVANALDALSGYAESRLTGTGACVFARFGDRSSAEKVYFELKDGWSVYLAKGVNKSPLHGMFEHGSV